MTQPIWNELDFRLSVVNRWQVMPTIRKQSVAEHQHNVAKIAERLAINIYGWGEFETRTYDVMRRALSHDDLEAIIGDPPSYTKPFVKEEEMAAEFGDLMRETWYADEVIPPQTKWIVKAADYIDAAVFLRVEISMGNRTVTGILRNLEYRFRTKCDEFTAEHGEEDFTGQMAYIAYTQIVDTMFGGNGQLTIEGFRF